MEQVALVVLGAVVGALATGGVTVYEIRERRATDTRVAARVILGDLAVLEWVCELILDRSAWPDRLNLSAMIDDWREHRTAFARGVNAGDWALVDGFYNNLGRTLPIVRLGEPCTESDLEVVRNVLRLLPRTFEIVLRRGAKQKELDRLAAEISERASRTST